MGLTAAFFWRIFEETGSINAYLAYKQLFSLMTLKKKKRIYIKARKERVVSSRNSPGKGCQRLEAT